MRRATRSRSHSRATRVRGPTRASTTSPSGDAAGGVVDGFVVAGDERGFKAAVDASDGGSHARGRRALRGGHLRAQRRPARPLLRQHARARADRSAGARPGLPRRRSGTSSRSPRGRDLRRRQRRRFVRGGRTGLARQVACRSSARAATSSRSCPPTPGWRSRSRTSARCSTTTSRRSARPSAAAT